jgi:alkylhydroperoxidase/carboxymuconolactone decarboxylase family protein YurZ
MNSAERILALTQGYPEHEQLIFLTALSVMWLEPQNPESQRLLEVYKERKHDLVALRETALQLSILAGFQTALEAAFQIHDVYGNGLPALEEEIAHADADLWFQRGQALQVKVYRGNTEKLNFNLQKLSPELATWTVLVGYGLVMSRSGLPRHWRELFEIAVLAVQGFPRQLHSHFRGARNLGATDDEIELVLRTIEGFMSEPRSKSAWQIWQKTK